MQGLHSVLSMLPPCPPAAAQGLQSLLTTLATSLPAFWNVGALLLLVLFLYAYMGGCSSLFLCLFSALLPPANFAAGSFPVRLHG